MNPVRIVKPHYFNIHFNVIFPSTPRYLQVVSSNQVFRLIMIGINVLSLSVHIHPSNYSPKPPRILSEIRVKENVFCVFDSTCILSEVLYQTFITYKKKWIRNGTKLFSIYFVWTQKALIIAVEIIGHKYHDQEIQLLSCIFTATNSS